MSKYLLLMILSMFLSIALTCVAIFSEGIWKVITFICALISIGDGFIFAWKSAEVMEEEEKEKIEKGKRKRKPKRKRKKRGKR